MPLQEASPCLHRAITIRRSHAVLVGKYRGIVWHVRRVGTTAGGYSDAPCRRAKRQHGNGHYTTTDCAECLFVRCFALGTRGGGHVFQRRQLGDESLGGMLAGAARGRPPPKASDWGDAGCVKRTWFTVLQIHLLLLGLGMMRPHFEKVSCVPKSTSCTASANAMAS